MKNILFFAIFLAVSINLFSQDGSSSSKSKHKIIIDNNTDPNIKVKLLSQLNSSYRDVNLSITPDGKYLFFMSDRGGQSWSSDWGYFRGRKMYDGDIWYSENINGQWSAPHVLQPPVNSSDAEDEPCVMPDGQRVYFQTWRTGWETNGGPYYMAELNGKQWGRPVGLGGGINRFFNNKLNKYGQYGTDGMAVSPDGKTFVVACGVNYDGNLDLYVSQNKNETWTYPRKMKISTSGDERSVFIAADGKTIYFSSDGLGGYGGLDIFRGTLTDDGEIVDVKNIGKPFNTPLDDFGFIITADGKQAFFVRDDDIYQATFVKTENEIAPSKTLLIGGTIKACNQMPMQTYLYLQDATGKIIDKSKSSDLGKFLFSIQFKTGTYQITDSNGKLLQEINVTDDSPTKLNFIIVNCKNQAGGAVVKH